MKKTFWCLGLALAFVAAIASPAATPADQAAVGLQPDPEAVAAPIAAEPLVLVEALLTPAAPLTSATELSLPLEPGRMACVPSECPCPAGYRCVAKCCVPL